MIPLVERRRREMRTSTRADARTTRQSKSGMSKASKRPKIAKKPWQRPKVMYLGRVDQIVRQARGKLSIPALDPGEPVRKPKGHDR